MQCDAQEKHWTQEKQWQGLAQEQHASEPFWNHARLSRTSGCLLEL